MSVFFFLFFFSFDVGAAAAWEVTVGFFLESLFFFCDRLHDKPNMCGWHTLFTWGKGEMPGSKEHLDVSWSILHFVIG